jgi:disulfide bond formation protein DsbB
MASIIIFSIMTIISALFVIMDIIYGNMSELLIRVSLIIILIMMVLGLTSSIVKYNRNPKPTDNIATESSAEITTEYIKEE